MSDRTVWIVVAIIVFGILSSFLVWVFKKYHCSKCGSWNSFTVTTTVLEWGGNMGNMLFHDPYYVDVHVRTCRQCMHVISEKREYLTAE